MENISLPKLEERILKFWKKNRIFEKSLAARNKTKPFRFFEGPPTANAGPGFHHAIARVFKDLICRYKTMRGFYVERKAGWDTHGLPVELQIEKELGFASKSDIEKFGIAKFNKLAKDSVWRYKEEWERFTDRLGFWLDLTHPYITYETSYIESLWWIIKHVWEKGFLEEDYKVVPWCWRCGTALSSHEVAQGYERVTDRSVYIRFPVKDKGKEWKNTAILSWTTTPWTLPGNVALAVNPKEEYVCVPDPELGGHWLVLGRKPFLQLLEKGIFPAEYRNLHGGEFDVFRGKKLIGVRYEPLFPVKELISKTSHRIYPADFVTMEEGTGVVHTAVMYGEDDFALGKKHKLPMHHTVDEKGRFKKVVPLWHGKFVKAKMVEEGIIKNLQDRKLLFREEFYEHDYPFCWRCHSPLLYYAHSSWFIRMTKLQKQLIANNGKVNWIPVHLREGRFGEWLREIRDWAFSRERYWGTPLPVWTCKGCSRQCVVGSLEELSGMAYGRNTFYRMRHGGATHVLKGYIAGWPEKKSMASHLTHQGRTQVERSAKQLAKCKIDIIVSSDLTRMKETVGILKRHLRQAKVTYDSRLREYRAGIFNYKPSKNFRRLFGNPVEKFVKKPRGGETLTQACERYFAVLKDLDKKYHGKRILIVGHGDPLWALEGKVKGLSPEATVKLPYPKLGAWEQLPYRHLPVNDLGEIDLHRPYIDAFLLSCPNCHSKMHRVKDVIDAWFDSGAMPFAQWHWPFENRERIAQGISFPADYISEGIDQTRGWFYTLLAVSTLLGKGPAYLNVISVGHILDAKGEKMSKSKGNIANPWELFERYGADSLRWYLCTVNPPGEPKKFSERDLKNSGQELTLLLNILNFWKTYSPKKIPRIDTKHARLSPLDQWIVARLSETNHKVAESLDAYDVREASLTISAFLGDLSRWYVRRSRRRFQRPKNQKELTQASAVLAWILLNFAKMMAPFTPFVSDFIWQELKTKLRETSDAPEESVHLSHWSKLPAPANIKILLQNMVAVRELASLTLKIRAQAGIRVRQPLSTLYIKKAKNIEFSPHLLSLLADEVNVKKVQLVQVLPAGEKIITAKEEEYVVALDTAITPRLEEEGMVRELLRYLQEARQEMGLHPQDLIRVEAFGEEEIMRFLRKHISFLKKESRARSFILQKPSSGFRKKFEVEGRKVLLGIKKR